MTETTETKKREPRKKPKMNLLQIFFLVGFAGVLLTIAHQHGVL